MDSNNGQYGGGAVLMNIPTSADILDIGNAFLTLPLAVQSSLIANAYNGAPVPSNLWYNFADNGNGDGCLKPKICMKQSTLSLITGLYIASVGGTAIVNETGGQLAEYNNMMLAIKNGSLFGQDMASQLCYAPDRFPHFRASFTNGYAVAANASWNDPTMLLGIYNDTVLNPLIPNLNTGSSPAAASYLPCFSPYNDTIIETVPVPSGGSNVAVSALKNVFYNQGFKERVDMFYKLCIFGSDVNGHAAAVAYMTAIIPIKYLHNFLTRYDTLSVNFGWQFQFRIDWIQSQNGLGNNPSPMMCDGLCPPPVLAIGGSISDADFLPACYLWVRKCTLRKSDNLRLATSIRSGINHEIIYQKVEQTRRTLGAQVGLDDNISVAVVNPKKVFINAMPSGNRSSPYTTMCTTIKTTNLNLNTNNTPFLQTPYNYDFLIFQMLYEQFWPETGSDINYQDWRQYRHIICFDLDRLGSKLSDVAGSVSLRLTGQRTDTYAAKASNFNSGAICNLDVVTFLVREAIAVFNTSTSGVQLAVGDYSQSAASVA